MRSRFEPDAVADASLRPPATLIDPEAYDASEQQFAASLDERARQRFVVDEASASEIGTAPANVEDRQQARVSSELQGSLGATTENRILPAEEDVPDMTSALHPETNAAQEETAASTQQSPDSWRQEVASRVNNYRARRRPRGPRYPSLKLKFEPDDIAESDRSIDQAATMTPRAAAMEDARLATAPSRVVLAEAMLSSSLPSVAGAEPTAKIIEFPRFSAAPSRLDELADPVLDRPRILEAPELVPPLPALGGILIEAAEPQPSERRPGFEMPLQSAPMSQRLVAVAIDTVLVLSSAALFAYIFWRITKEVPPPQHALVGAMVLVGVLWAAYHYLLLVYCGITPGLNLAKLRLSRFDGSPVARRVRRWRVLASVLSGVSLGLGYAWCFLDEDELCWHDRITRTYIAPKA
jgi:uncharacterized RDD family membrane protein YckC